MTTPYVGFSNATLGKLPRAQPGDRIVCPKCGERHRLEGAEGDEPDLLMFYRCKDGVQYLGGVRGRNVVDVKADASGRI